MSKEQTTASRRGFFISASAIGATVATVALVKNAPAPMASPAAPKPAPEKGGGYSLSEHVKRYYQTTLV